MSEAVAGDGARGPARPRLFRWQALAQHTADALFVLDRRRRLVFVNRAWEELAGLSGAHVYGLACRRPRPAAASDPPEEVLAHALTPPPEVFDGQTARARRLLPGTVPRWWDVEFFPLRQADERPGWVVLGRARPVPAAPTAAAQLPERLLALRERQARRHGPELLAGTSPATRRLAEQVRLAAGLTTPALLVGEPGSGKRTLARVIHFLGPTRDRGLAALDCRGLPPDALSAVLFGAAGSPLGTIYLAEPSALPRELQLRLCELLARRAADRGATAGPRVLAGSSADPAAEVAAGRLLDELRCALSPLVLEVPPLRARADELPTLVQRLLARVREEEEGPAVTGLSPEAWELLRSYPWPGNLRELHAALVGAARHAKGERIEAADLPAAVRLERQVRESARRAADRVIPLDQVLETAERRLLELALRRARGNRTRAAELLAIWRPRLIRRLEALGLSESEEDS